MTMLRFLSAVPGCLVYCTLAACGGDSTADPVGRWLGDQPHLEMHGHLNGEDIAVSMAGVTMADGSAVWCEREYLVPTVNGAADLAQAMQSVVTVAGYADVAGEERYFELELRSHSLQTDAPDTVVDIVPRDEAHPPHASEMWFEMEWTSLDGEDLLEAAAQEGRFVLGQYTGSPGEGGVVIAEGGHVGGYAEARWSLSDSLKVSFSVLCMLSEVEEF